MKHMPRVDWEKLGFEQVDKKMEAEEAAQVIAASAEKSVPEPKATLPSLVEGDDATAV